MTNKYYNCYTVACTRCSFNYYFAGRGAAFIETWIVSLLVFLVITDLPPGITLLLLHGVGLVQASINVVSCNVSENCRKIWNLISNGNDYDRLKGKNQSQSESEVNLREVASGGEVAQSASHQAVPVPMPLAKKILILFVIFLILCLLPLSILFWINNHSSYGANHDLINVLFGFLPVLFIFVLACIWTQHLHQPVHDAVARISSYLNECRQKPFCSRWFRIKYFVGLVVSGEKDHNFTTHRYKISK